MNEFLRFVDLSKTIPDMSVWRDRVDMIPAKGVVDYLSE